MLCFVSIIKGQHAYPGLKFPTRVLPTTYSDIIYYMRPVHPTSIMPSPTHFTLKYKQNAFCPDPRFLQQCHCTPPTSWVVGGVVHFCIYRHMASTLPTGLLVLLSPKHLSCVTVTVTVFVINRCVLGNTTILAEFVSEEDVARYIAHSQAGGAGSAGTSAGSAGSGPTATSAVGTNGSGGSCERGGAGGMEGGSTAGGAPSGGTGFSSSGWQSLDGTGSSSDQSATQGPGLGIFAQWSSNGAGGVGTGGVESGRQGLWGGMGGMGGAGYPSSSLWGSPALEDRHQMGSPASLLPGDLLGGGAD